MRGIIYFEDRTGELNCWEISACDADTAKDMEEHFNRYAQYVNGMNFIGAELWHETMRIMTQ